MAREYGESQNSNSYKERLTRELKNPSFYEAFSYDPQGFLVLNQVEGHKGGPIRILDLLNRYSEGGVLQITDLRMVKRRARQLKDLFMGSAEAVGYPTEKLQLHYAFKANTKGPFVLSALSELHGETSGELDLYNIQKMRRRNYIPKDIKVISNGFKNGWRQGNDRGYAQRIIDAHREGIDITAVLVPNEINFFLKNVTKGILQVGLRLKFGQVSNDHDLDNLVSRFGFGWNDLTKEAAKINKAPNLKLTMLHAMISAAHTTEPNALATSALFAAEKWAQLKREYPSLTHLNFGGGFPTIDSGYDHGAFLKIYLSGVKEICKKYGVDLPTIVVESGSFVAADAEHLVYPIVDVYQNSSKKHNEMNIAGTIMDIQDIWVQEDPFTFVGTDHANETPIAVRLGDATCDSNCVYPPKTKPDDYILIPRNAKGVVAIDVGAYQDVLGTVTSQKEAKAVNHCGQRVPRQLYIMENGQVWVNTTPSMEEMSNLSGFDDDMLALAK